MIEAAGYAWQLLRDGSDPSLTPRKIGGDNLNSFGNRDFASEGEGV
jgi:hypothetical protein